jgi:hypothetical protein
MSERDSICASEEKPEEWKPLVGFEGRYEISSYGRVQSLDSLDRLGRRHKGKVLDNARISGRYLYVRLMRECRVVSKAVHIAVLEAFVGPRPTGMHGCHDPDRDTRNNRLSNLRWDTPSANQQDKIRHGTIARGERNGFAKLAVWQVSLAVAAYEHGVLVGSVAKAIGVNRNHVTHLATGKVWSHLRFAPTTESQSKTLRDWASVSQRIGRVRHSLTITKRADKRQMLEREIVSLHDRERDLIAIACTYWDTRIAKLSAIA